MMAFNMASLNNIIKKFNLSVVLKCISGLIILITIWPSRFATRYEYIDRSRMFDELVPETTRNISLQQLEDCYYKDIISNNEFNRVQDDIVNRSEILPGGEYFPSNCRALFSSAVIVPYRRRKTQLDRFLMYMHNYLRRQRIHYRIFIIEQADEKPFNRAKLLNIGSEIAVNYEFPCLIFHDVDILPQYLGHLYSCTTYPRHMCSNLDVFRYHLPYLGLFGGVVSIRTTQFQHVNGMSNLFSGWGGEDDDFYERIKSRNFKILRFEPDYNIYTMMPHKKEIPSDERLNYLNTGPLRYYTDGLNSLSYKNKGIEIHDLYTHVLVEI